MFNFFANTWFAKLAKNKKKTIGRLEYINIPELGLNNVVAKIDTGAYRGAIHATDIQEVVGDSGKKELHFSVLDFYTDNMANLDDTEPTESTESTESPESADIPELKKTSHVVTDYKEKKFRGTKTDLHDRYVIPITIEIAGESLEAELSLTDRRELRYPVLIGRRALKHRFLVDVNKKV